jgi:two-component system sensor histidine kinase DegS
LFLTAQEAVNNSLKHAQPKSVQVSLQNIKGELWLEISDDGTGMLPNWDYGQFACEGHMGLVGMRMRVERLGGQFELFSEKNHGTTVHIRIPLEQQEDNQPLRGLPRVVGEFELEPVDIETLVL